MSQFARPDGNVTQTSFTNGFAEIDEASPSDADFAYGANNTAAVLEVSLGNVTDPASSSGHTFRYRIAKTNAGTVDGAGNAVTVTAALYQGTTQIAADSAQTATGTWTQYSFTLSGAEADAITDYSDLRLRFTTSASGGSPANRRGGAVSWAELEVPDAPTAVQLSGTGRASPARGTGTLLVKVLLSSLGRATVTAGVGLLTTSLALAGIGRATTVSGRGDLTTHQALAGTGQATLARGQGTLTIKIPLTGTGRATPTRSVVPSWILAYCQSVSRGTEPRGYGILTQHQALTGTGRATTARAVAQLGFASVVVQLAGTGRATATRGQGILTSRQALAGTGRAIIARGSGVLTTRQALVGTGQATPARGQGQISFAVVTLNLAGTGRATPARGQGILTARQALVGTGRAIIARGSGVLTSHLALAGTGRATPARGRGLLTSRVALVGTGRATDPRGYGSILAKIQLVGTGRATEPRGYGVLASRQALRGTGRATEPRGYGVLTQQLALTGTGRQTSPRAVAFLNVINAGVVPLVGTGRATPALGIGVLTIIESPPIHHRRRAAFFEGIHLPEEPIAAHGHATLVLSGHGIAILAIPELTIPFLPDRATGVPDVDVVSPDQVIVVEAIGTATTVVRTSGRASVSQPVPLIPIQSRGAGTITFRSLGIGIYDETEMLQDVMAVVELFELSEVDIE